MPQTAGFCVNDCVYTCICMCMCVHLCLCVCVYIFSLEEKKQCWQVSSGFLELVGILWVSNFSLALRKGSMIEKTEPCKVYWRELNFCVGGNYVDHNCIWTGRHPLQQHLLPHLRTSPLPLIYRVSHGSPGWPRTHDILQTSLRGMAALLLQPPKCSDYRQEPLHPASTQLTPGICKWMNHDTNIGHRKFK